MINLLESNVKNDNLNDISDLPNLERLMADNNELNL